MPTGPVPVHLQVQPAVELALIAWGLGSQLAAVPFVDAAALAYVVPGNGRRAALCLAEPERSFAPGDPGSDAVQGNATGHSRPIYAGR